MEDKVEVPFYWIFIFPMLVLIFLLAVIITSIGIADEIVPLECTTENFTVYDKFFDVNGNHVIDSQGYLYNVQDSESYYKLKLNETFSVSILVPHEWDIFSRGDHLTIVVGDICSGE